MDNSVEYIIVSL